MTSPLLLLDFVVFNEREKYPEQARVRLHKMKELAYFDECSKKTRKWSRQYTELRKVKEGRSLI